MVRWRLAHLFMVTTLSGVACAAGTVDGDPRAGGGGGGGMAGFGGSFSAGGDAPPCPPCSADLMNVIDCNGAVVKACGPNAGCANGVCIADPCKAAADAKSSFGCDYWALETGMIPIGSKSGACFVMFVANAWSAPAHIQVDYLGSPLPTQAFAVVPSGQGAGLTYAPYDAGSGLAPGQVAILSLSRDPDGPFAECPSTPAVLHDASVHGTGRGHAFHVRSDVPVTAFQMLPYGGGNSAATSATLLIPTTAWDTNYIAISAYEKSSAVLDAVPLVALLAREDDTQVTILPKHPIVGSAEVEGGPANAPLTYTLGKGEFVQLAQNDELTGSVVQSNKPIGLWGGATCMNVPVSAQACDTAQQQIPPIKAIGRDYAGVSHRPRYAGTSESAPWRLVGLVDGTTLSWEPAPPPGAPSGLQAGQVAEFSTGDPFVVRSQGLDHPFYLATYMTGCRAEAESTVDDCRGDPEWVNVVSTEQFLDKYVFFADPTYPETNLVLVRRPGPNGKFADVTLDCGGVVTGWTPLGSYELARVDLSTGNFHGVGGCSNGPHTIHSAAPFGLTVWGWGSAATGGVYGKPNAGGFYTQAVSYAYPAGASVSPINSVVIPPK